VRKGPQRFLRLVGAGYVLLGGGGLAALYLHMSNLLPLIGIVSPFTMVTPLGLTFPNGIQASCDGQPRGAWGCNLDLADIARARATLTVLCLAAIGGGVLCIWGASARNPWGRTIWLALTAISLLVTAANLSFPCELPYNPLMAFASIVWSGAYAWAAALLFRRGHIPTDTGV
jgi:hypothetical protein